MRSAHTAELGEEPEAGALKGTARQP
jgi:hypothetical protein